MRNPRRINKLMVLLELIWQECPDIRFNQLIHNLQVEYNQDKSGVYTRELWEKNEHRGIVSYHQNPVTDLFYVEDEEFITFLEKKLVDNHKK
jgi:uncharacterized protein YihD (DUF1040 family)